ncbi:MAG: HIT domain-containing protein [Bacteroidetes bacterium]|nr:HIT domain-containing protein [Bacteroidota bacterium]
MNCVFCQIVDGKAKADFIFNEDDVFAIRDVHPVAPTHILIIPKKHVRSLMELDGTDGSLLISKMVTTAVEVAKRVALAERGFRLVWNCRADGGQTVDHIHLHLLGGRQMKWPPG